MKDVILLTKILFKTSKSNTKKEFKKKSDLFFTIIVFLFIYAYLAGVIGYISYEAINSLMLVGKETIFLNIVFCGALGYSVFQSIFSCLNVLFFSKDLDSLLPLPIKPIKIVMAKFNCLVISQYIMYAVVLLPILVVYGFLLKVGILFYIYSLLTLLVFPVIPVVITSLLVTIIMRFTNIIKNKETVQYLAVGISILIIIVIQFFFSTANNGITNEEIANKLIQANDNLSNYTNIFINVKSAVNTILNYNNLIGLYNYCILLFETGVIYFIISFITSKFYNKELTSIMTNGVKKKNSVDLKKKTKRNTLWKSYLIKELKILYRNPIFLMQCILPPILLPLISIVPSLMSISNSGDDLFILQTYLSDYVNTSIGLISAIEVIELFFIFNFTSITSISRDGESAKFIKYIPIDFEKQCKYKILIGTLLNIIPIIYVLVFLKIFLINTKIITLVYIFILAMILNIFNNWLVIIVDLKHPKLEWMTEYAVVKQNLNMFYQMIIIITEMGLIFAIGFKIYNLNILMILFSTVFIVLTILIKKYIKNNQKELFNKIY